MSFFTFLLSLLLFFLGGCTIPVQETRETPASVLQYRVSVLNGDGTLTEIPGAEIMLPHRQLGEGYYRLERSGSLSPITPETPLRAGERVVEVFRENPKPPIVRPHGFGFWSFLVPTHIRYEVDLRPGWGHSYGRYRTYRYDRYDWCLGC